MKSPFEHQVGDLLAVNTDDYTLLWKQRSRDEPLPPKTGRYLTGAVCTLQKDDVVMLLSLPEPMRQRYTEDDVYFEAKALTRMGVGWIQLYQFQVI